MLNAADPVAAGIIRSLARPGGNITGLTDFDDNLYPKRFELLKTAAPRIGRLSFVENTTLLDAAKAGALNKQYEAAARALGLGLTRIALNGTRDFERATTAIVGEGADALVLGHSATVYLLRKEFGEFAIRQRLPTVAANRTDGSGGALMSYGQILPIVGARRQFMSRRSSTEPSLRICPSSGRPRWNWSST